MRWNSISHKVDPVAIEIETLRIDECDEAGTVFTWDLWVQTRE